MQLILIPGLWLDAGSWHGVVPTIDDAGFDAVALTLPSSPETHLADWVAAVVARIDHAGEPVVLVGHSGGGNVAWGAADARPEAVSRVVFVDTVPAPDGASIATFPVVDGVIPFPGWDAFDAPDVADLDGPTRTRVAAAAVPVPASVPTDPLHLHDRRRHGIPVTVLSGGADADELDAQLAQWPSFRDEWQAIVDREVVPIGSGHWPQFSQPQRLGELIVRAVER
ncbi:pimeloyl-ACP methyl ester carboxylesterase [Microbacterium sp. SORGH_AS428]|uniref:alpha/beta fold hydrolase n=1 Tax=Microbacterium sp. SORGH_AS_0428 TaxID=3041788 RepID=UPI0028649DA4|nr:alpha/beta fold hydrolase [Microbacterium sp. SORGH_AS_0428]MDR6198349.1 pimeloyl-ACP methyl ester carboxylesterase [Microbacterium sp. SORGH_AS_0428]